MWHRLIVFVLIIVWSVTLVMASSQQLHTLTPPLSNPGFDVSGRVFVITGGTQGLGFEIAKQLKEKGAIGLVLVSRSADKGATAAQALTSINCKCCYVSADLNSAEDAAAIIPKAISVMQDVGPISGLVNAAAVTQRGNLMTTTASEFDMQMATNVRAPFLITQAVAKHMIEKGIRGSIVNICSVAAHGGAPFIMAYCASKAALVTLTKNNAAELAPKGIRVNGVNMGWCYTDNEDKLQSATKGPNWIEEADKGVPLGRIIRPADVAASVGFLLSDSAAMLTGSFIELHPEYAEGMQGLVADETDRV